MTAATLIASNVSARGSGTAATLPNSTSVITGALGAVGVDGVVEISKPVKYSPGIVVAKPRKPRLVPARGTTRLR
jgi:hypothetical protein